MKPIANKLTPEADALYSKAQRSLRANLDRILSVSKEDDEKPSKLTQVELSEVSGIARSTVTKILSTAEPSSSNPDLRTLCRLAETLKVPPAFLLMSADDWSRLASAIAGLQFAPRIAPESESVRRLATDQVALRATDWADQVQPPMANAELLEDHPDAARGAWQESVRRMRQQSRQSVKAMALAPDWGMVKGDVDSLFQICVLMGAATRI